MQVVIPMSGTGSRFIRAGYTTHKSLLEVNSIPILQHIIEMYGKDHSYIFIPSLALLETFDLDEFLSKLDINFQIFPIKPHKLGPVFAVSQVFDHIADTEPVVVNYCDFSCIFDHSKFSLLSRNSTVDGIVPAYVGFHPHSLGSTNYAYIRHDNLRVLEIQEKKPFTDNKLNEYASTGAYFFKDGRLLKTYFQRTLQNPDMAINGEFYCSVVYNLMVEDGLNIQIFDIPYFMQWGTPGDYETFCQWSEYFSHLSDDSLSSDLNILNAHESINLIPIAGFGRRFLDEGFKGNKAFLKMLNLPMYAYSLNCLPASRSFIATRTDLIDEFKESIAQSQIQNLSLIDIGAATKGQADTVFQSLKELPDFSRINITCCDHSLVYDPNCLKSLLSDDSIQLIVWTVANYAPALNNPFMYGWVQSSGPDVTAVSCKKPFPDNSESFTITGTFTFKDKDLLQLLLSQLLNSNQLINGEYYLDSLVDVALKNNLKVANFVVDSFICTGTPNEYKTFCYYANLFSEWESHSFTVS